VALFAVVGIFIFVGHNSAAQAASKRRSDASRAIPVRTAAATTGTVDRNVDALGTVTALNTVTVRSRVDGPLVAVPFQEGQLVTAGALLAKIDPRTFQVALDQAAGQLAHDQSQLADARVDLDRYNGLPSHHRRVCRSLGPAHSDPSARRKGEELTVDALDRDGKPLAHGKLAAVDNQIDVTTGTVKLKGQFDNTDDALFPAQFVSARLKVATLSGVTLVPSAAVQRGAPGTFVYVVDANNTVTLRKVTLGPAAGDLVSISAGVKPGEQVVIDGVDKLRDGAKVSRASGGGGKPAAAGAHSAAGAGTGTGADNAGAAAPGSGKGSHRKKPAADGQATS